MKNILFVGENAGRYRRPKKFAKQIKSKSSGKPTRQKPVPPLKPGKKVPQWLAEQNFDQGEKSFPNPPAQCPVGQKSYLLLVRKY